MGLRLTCGAPGTPSTFIPFPCSHVNKRFIINDGDNRCIMLELFTKKPVFQGNDEIHQLDVVYKILGTPVPERWPGVTDLPWYELVKPREVIHDRFRELFQK